MLRVCVQREVGLERTLLDLHPLLVGRKNASSVRW